MNWNQYLGLRSYVPPYLIRIYIACAWIDIGKNRSSSGKADAVGGRKKCNWTGNAFVTILQADG
jgi:hypothetical protein